MAYNVYDKGLVQMASGEIWPPYRPTPWATAGVYDHRESFYPETAHRVAPYAYGYGGKDINGNYQTLGGFKVQSPQSDAG